MINLIVLLKAVLNLAAAVVDLPDWRDEASIEAWIDGFQSELAKVIALLVPDMLVGRDYSIGAALMRRANRAAFVAAATDAIVTEFQGKRVADVDWAVIIDWIVNLLSTLLPAYAAIIQMVGGLIKQLLILLEDEIDKLDDVVKKAYRIA